VSSAIANCTSALAAALTSGGFRGCPLRRPLDTWPLGLSVHGHL